MIVEIFRMGLGLLIVCFHRQIADFILVREQRLAAFFKQRGVDVPAFPSPKVAHDLYFILGAAVTLVSILRLFFNVGS